MSRAYFTTPIYYVNAEPHLGHTYTTVVGDALARYHRARGDETYYVTGTDEHGQKIEQIAAKAGVPPKTYCDGIAAKFEHAWQRLGISYDGFIRTTDEGPPRPFNHRAAVEDVWKRLVAAGDVKLGDYEGLYCTGCEGWKTDDELIVGPGDGGPKLCAIHKKPVDKIKEQNYFFDLGKYADRLLAAYAGTGPDGKFEIWPESRRNEVESFVRGGLERLSFSRTTVKWGFPVPGDAQHTIYVWADALTNYVSALGGPAAILPGAPKHDMWKSCVHLIAKDILRFHAVYWPAMLMSAGLPLPRGVFCHGYLTVKGEKMSKSMPATRVDPLAIADELGADALRYFLLREYALGGDGDFTYESLFQRHESDLGNDLGNLVNRTVSLARRNLGGKLPAATPDAALADLAHARRPEIETHWRQITPSRALEATWELVRAGNRYIDQQAPWKLAKESKTAELGAVLANACEVARWAAMLAAPVMPSACATILRQIGRAADVGRWPVAPFGFPGAEVGDPVPVFPRVDKDRQAALIDKWVPAESAAATPREIEYPDFEKLHLVAAKVLACERVPKTDKLLKLSLDVGEPQPRTVISGIADVFAPEQMVGRTVIYLANLKPRTMRGVVSQGMILAAGDEKVIGLSALDRDVPPGTRVR